MVAEPRQRRVSSLIVRNEAVTMALYVCLVEVAELVAIEDRLDTAAAAIAAIWGTSVGLALAHVFAFGLASSMLNDGQISRETGEAIGWQLAASAVVAGALSLPFVVFPVSAAQQVAGYLAAGFVGLCGYLVARRSQRSKAGAVIFGLGVTLVASIVVSVKALLAAH